MRKCSCVVKFGLVTIFVWLERIRLPLGYKVCEADFTINEIERTNSSFDAVVCNLRRIFCT
jgi:hypothetical protein